MNSIEKTRLRWLTGSAVYQLKYHDATNTAAHAKKFIQIARILKNALQKAQQH